MTSEAYSFTTPAFIPVAEGVPVGLPAGMTIEPGIGVGKPDDAPPAFLKQPELVPMGQTVAVATYDQGDGCCAGLKASPHTRTAAAPRVACMPRALRAATQCPRGRARHTIARVARRSVDKIL